MATIGQAFPGIPLIANMVEGSVTPQLDNASLFRLGFQIIFYPSTIIRASLYAAQNVLRELRDQDTTRHLEDQILGFSELNALVGLDDIGQLENRYVWSGEEPKL